MHRFNSHLNIALPDLAEASALHQSVTPYNNRQNSGHGWNLLIYSQIPSAHKLPRGWSATSHRLIADRDE